MRRVHAPVSLAFSPGPPVRLWLTQSIAGVPSSVVVDASDVEAIRNALAAFDGAEANARPATEDAPTPGLSAANADCGVRQ